MALFSSCRYIGNFVWIFVWYHTITICLGSLDSRQVDTRAIDTFKTNGNVRLIAFGSCARQDKPQPFWNTLRDMKPDAWFWTGDVVYSECPSLECLQSAYGSMKRNENYTRFVSGVPFVDGVWDDHDYGMNDGGRDLPFKNESKHEFLSFLNVPKTSPRYQREGAYSSHVFPIVSETSDRAYVKVILLDTRYSRDQPLLLHRLGQYRFPLASYIAAVLRFFVGLPGLGTDHNGDILDEEQWEWLTNQFREDRIGNHSVAVTIVVSSIQVFSQVPLFESWNLYSKSKKRLINLIQETQPPGLHFVSGDVHMGQLLGTLDCVPEVTASGLTHTVLKHGLFGAIVMDILLPLFWYPFYPERDQQTLTPLEKKQAYAGRNFGTFELEFNTTGLYVHGAVRDLQGRPKLGFHKLVERSRSSYNCLTGYPTFPKPNLGAGLLVDFIIMASLASVTLMVAALCVASMRRFCRKSKTQTTMHSQSSTRTTASASRRGNRKEE